MPNLTVLAELKCHFNLSDQEESKGKEYLCMTNITFPLHLAVARPLINIILFEFYCSSVSTRIPTEVGFGCPGPVLFQLHCTAPRMPGMWLFIKWTSTELTVFLQ